MCLIVVSDQELKHSLGYWIKHVEHAITNRSNEILKPYGLARSQWQVLYHIERSNGLTQKDLQEKMKVESGTLTSILDSLVRKGWVIRQENPSDRRMKLLTLTEEAEKRWSDVPDLIGNVRRQMMKGLQSEDIQHVIQVLQVVLDNLRKGDK